MTKPFYSSEARKIGITNRSVSGYVPDIGAYESTLERDFMELLRFDPGFEKIIPQPLTIGFDAPDGSSRSYTPDGLLFYRDELYIRPVLYEIKYRDDFRGQWRTLLPKFKAAKRMAQVRGWEFKVFTEKEIRTPYLDNVKFLWRYRELSVEEGMKDHVLSTLSDLQEADPDLLLTSLCSSLQNRALMIPVIWNLICHRRIGCDMDSPLTMHTKIWVRDNDEND